VADLYDDVGRGLGLGFGPRGSGFHPEHGEWWPYGQTVRGEGGDGKGEERGKGVDADGGGGGHRGVDYTDESVGGCSLDRGCPLGTSQPISGGVGGGGSCPHTTKGSHPKPQNRNPQTLRPKFEALNPQPSTLHP